MTIQTSKQCSEGNIRLFINNNAVATIYVGNEFLLLIRSVFIVILQIGTKVGVSESVRFYACSIHSQCDLHILCYAHFVVSIVQVTNTQILQTIV